MREFLETNDRVQKGKFERGGRSEIEKIQWLGLELDLRKLESLTPQHLSTIDTFRKRLGYDSRQG